VTHPKDDTLLTTTKTIVTCALTGSVHTPSMSEALPITADDMIQQGLEAAAAGAAILHLHARDPKTGRPTPDPDVYETFLPAIKDGSDAILNLTTGGSSAMSVEERLAAAIRFEPELASLNMGSMNFVFSGAGNASREWKYDWERPYLLDSEQVIFANTYAQIRRTLVELGKDRGTRFEFECYDVGHLYTLARFMDEGLVETPALIQCIFGVVGGIGADHQNLTHMIAIADQLFGDSYVLSAFAAGRQQMAFATHSALRGGQVRVGLEDSLYIGAGRLATSNAEQVRKVVDILAELGHEIATPKEARELLGLKGPDQVRF
jgi:uncharacterized protein (DUF849 family)